jgi:hypothetical protein
MLSHHSHRSVMKLWGTGLILGGISAWAYVGWWTHRECSDGGVWLSCYELGSVAWPFPPFLRAAGLLGFISVVMGIVCFVYCFARRKRKHSLNRAQGPE